MYISPFLPVCPSYRFIKNCLCYTNISTICLLLHHGLAIISSGRYTQKVELLYLARTYQLPARSIGTHRLTTGWHRNRNRLSRRTRRSARLGDRESARKRLCSSTYLLRDLCKAMGWPCG